MSERHFYLAAEIEVSKWETTGDEEYESSEMLWKAEICYEYSYWADGGAFLGWRNPFESVHKHRIKDRRDEERRVANLNIIRLAEIRSALAGMGVPGLRTPQSIKTPNVWKEGKGWITFVVPDEESTDVQ